MNLLVKLIINALAVFLTAWLLPGVELENFYSAIWVALFLALLNVTIKPLLIFFTLPVTVISLGLFLLVINALVILMADSLVDGFFVRSFGSAFLFSILLSIISSFLNRLRDDEGKRG